MYDGNVRRTLASLLLALFGISLTMPMVLAGESAEAKLPACCRKDGKHACGMNKKAVPVDGPAFQASPMRCGFYPSGGVTAGVDGAEAAVAAAVLFTLGEEATGPERTGAAMGLAIAGWPERGPPVFHGIG